MSVLIFSTSKNYGSGIDHHGYDYYPATPNPIRNSGSFPTVFQYRANIGNLRSYQFLEIWYAYAVTHFVNKGVSFSIQRYPSTHVYFSGTQESISTFAEDDSLQHLTPKVGTGQTIVPGVNDEYTQGYVASYTASNHSLPVGVMTGSHIVLNPGYGVSGEFYTNFKFAAQSISGTDMTQVASVRIHDVTIQVRGLNSGALTPDTLVTENGPPSWTQWEIGKKNSNHAFVIPVLSSSDDLTLRMNTYISGS